MTHKRNIPRILYICASLFSFLLFLSMGLTAYFGISQSNLWIFLGVLFALCAAATFLPIKKPLRIAWRTLLCIGLCIVLFFCGMVVTDMFDTLPDGLDYIIVLGARVDKDGTPSKALMRRIKLAKGYLDKNPETIVVATGGKGADECMSEADCIAQTLTEMGLSPERIVLEDKSTSTDENFVNARTLIPENALVGFVSNNFHIRRSKVLAQRAGFPDIAAGATPFHGPLLIHYTVREALGLILIQLGLG